jgi:formylglycine-generating enzyme required for sulfatase activity
MYASVIVSAVALAAPAHAFNEPGTGVQASVDRAEVVVVRSADEDGTARERPMIAGSGTPFRDCKDQAACPQMLVIPSTDRSIELGTIESVAERQDQSKVRRVTLEAFAIGKYEVSVGEYQACVSAGACRPPEWREPGSQFHIETGRNNYYKRLGDNVTGKHFPIVGVSWNDAVAYAAWLSQQTGQAYRLPSDAEWEYAARAGTRTLYWWGDSEKAGDKVMAACRGCGGEFDGVNNAPVAGFPPNPWGLHNVHGNVWEWVADFYCDDFRSGPGDGGARTTDDCPVRDGANLHVLRGGSSFYEARFMKASVRLRNFNDFRNFSVGFRVARTLLPSTVPSPAK